MLPFCEFSSDRLNSVENSIYVLGKARKRSIPSLRSLPNVAFLLLLLERRYFESPICKMNVAALFSFSSLQ